MTSLTPIGLLGDGRAVLQIAERLAAAGHRVLVYTPPGLHAPQHSKRIERAATPTDIAYECRIVLSRLWGNDTLRDVILGDGQRDGLGGDMHAGSVVVDLCARWPRDLQALLGLLGTRAVSVVDAALMSGEPRTVLLGGFIDAVELVQPVLQALGTVTRTGPLGSAHTAAAILALRAQNQRTADVDARTLAMSHGMSGARLDALFPQCAADDSPDDTAARVRLAQQLMRAPGSDDAVQGTTSFAIQHPRTRLRLA